MHKSVKMDEPSDSTSISHDQKEKGSLEKATNEKLNVYIWDMDETIILLKSLLNGTYAMAFNGSKDVQKGIEIGKRWETRILQACDEFFFYEQIENYNEPFLDSLREYDDGRDLSDYDFSKDDYGPPYDDPNKRKLAFRHRMIGQKYAQGLHDVLDHEMIKVWDDLYELTDAYTDRWLSSARAFLELLSVENRVSTCVVSPPESDAVSTDVKCQNLNVLVTSGSLIPTLVKCLLFRLDDLITHGNIYSSWEVGKLRCFSWIKERFGGPGVQFCVIGDGPEECEAAQFMKWPFIRINLRPNGTHRFPGLTTEAIDRRISTFYGIDAKNERIQDLKNMCYGRSQVLANLRVAHPAHQRLGVHLHKIPWQRYKNQKVQESKAMQTSAVPLRHQYEASKSWAHCGMALI